jgi:hypothetical protein
MTVAGSKYSMYLMCARSAEIYWDYVFGSSEMAGGPGACFDDARRGRWSTSVQIYMLKACINQIFLSSSIFTFVIVAFVVMERISIAHAEGA